MQQIIADVSGILKAPFKGPLDLWHLFLIVGLSMIFAAAWIFILNHIKIAAAAVATEVI